jgi:hypothetical protein
MLWFFFMAFVVRGAKQPLSIGATTLSVLHNGQSVHQSEIDVVPGFATSANSIVEVDNTAKVC